MDSQHLLNVLNMLRLLKADKLQSKPATKVIQEWCGGTKSDGLILKAAANIQDEIELAYTALKNAHLSDEAKEGILPKLLAFRSAFNLTNINSPIAGSLPDIPGMVTTIAVVLDAAGVQQQIEPPQEAADLISAIEKCIGDLDPEMDPILRELARKHMEILIAMLQNLKIFGSEAAYSAYFELMTKVQRADAHSSDSDRKKSKSLIERLKSWSELMSSVQKIWDAGSGIVTATAKIVPLLSHNSAQ